MQRNFLRKAHSHKMATFILVGRRIVLVQMQCGTDVILLFFSLELHQNRNANFGCLTTSSFTFAAKTTFCRCCDNHFAHLNWHREKCMILWNGDDKKVFLRFLGIFRSRKSAIWFYLNNTKVSK